MIKVSSLNKYYYQNKDREIHVINDASLELGSTGLVAFLGESGSGKTTLLNVISGLDKATTGVIEYDNLKFEKYNMDKIDMYRQKNIGYIFQNYLLLEDVTVYDNLKIALELINVFDENEQKARIEYALKAVGLYKYRKKQASRLSGGQQQRVSIARALIKKCKLIIADEPTGNLDSDNTIEVMNILKKISEHTLVLLVTHNQELASFYATRIIKIKDGTIIEDKENISSGELSNKNEKRIHLLDFENKKGTIGNTNIDIYQNGDSNIDIKIVIKNNTIYVESNQKVVSTKDNDIKLINDHYQNLNVQDISSFDFDISWFQDGKKKNSFKIFLSLLKSAFISHYKGGKWKRIFHLIFIFIGVALAFSLTSFTKYLEVDASAFPNENLTLLDDGSSYYGANANYNSDDVIEAYEKGYIENVYEYQAFDRTFRYYFNYQRVKSVSVSSYVFSDDLVSKLIYGRKALNKDEIVISKGLADTILKKIPTISYKQLLNQKIGDYEIVGISNNDTTSVYMNNKYLSLYSPYENYYNEYPTFYYKDYEVGNYVITSGEDIQNSDEILINENYYYAYSVGTEKLTISGKDYTIKGKFRFLNTNYEHTIITLNKSLLGYQFYGDYSFEKIDVGYYNLKLTNLDFYKENEDYVLVEGTIPSNKNEVLANVYSGYNINDKINDYKIVGLYRTSDNMESYAIFLTNKTNFEKNLINNKIGSIGFKIKNSDEVLSFFKDKNINVEKMSKHYYDYVASENASSRLSSLAVTIVLLVSCMIYIYFTTRSRLINQIKELGVYRSIGATRWQIIKSYLVNIFVDTTTTSLLGYLVTAFLSSYITQKINALLGNTLNLHVGYILLGIIVIYLVNIVIGIIPVLTLLHKTPSEINSKYDI